MEEKMTINEVIRKELTTFELTELQRIMEAVERHSYLTSGYNEYPAVSKSSHILVKM